MRTIRLRLALRDVVPEVVRVIDVPSATTLPELHDLCQAAMGWTDSHLHQFVVGDRTYGVADREWGEELHEDEAGVRLRDLPTRFVYRYDLGDCWDHDVEVLGAGGEQPGCVQGSGGCPPEDCGGAPGYEELSAVLADPAHEEHARMREWAGELPTFEREATDLRLRQTVGAVPGSVRLLLDLCAGGVRLTPGGRLPRSIVREVQQRRPQWNPSGKPARIEDDLVPLAALHDILRRVGLLRMAKGILTPTRKTGDDLEIIRGLRSWFEPGSFGAVLAAVTVAHLAAHGPMDGAELAEAVCPWLERWSVDGRPLAVADMRIQIARQSSELRALDLVGGDWRQQHAGPSALKLLPRATGLAALLPSRAPAR